VPECVAPRAGCAPATRGAATPIGLRQVDEDEWELHYGPLLIGRVLMRDGKPHLERVA
jgi:hypothetical protein